jgi:hypothetical protein
MSRATVEGRSTSTQVYRHVIVLAIRRGATVMDDVFGDDAPDESN